MYKKIIRKIVDNGKKEDMEKISDITEDAMEHLRECDEEKYDEIMCDLKELAYGKVITEEDAHQWVINMKPYGEHWNMATTTSVKNGNFKDIDWYIVMNMMYNDYYSVAEDDTELYVKMAQSFLDDKDAIENKLYNYKKYIAKKV